jgi:RHS repeat-associated protein
MGTDPLFVKTDGAYYWYENDHQGTPQKIISTSGSVVWSAVPTDSFGNIQIQAESITSNLRMPGQYFDEETGLYYNWHRYYDPAIGRYLQTDPIGDGLNLYAYCNNDPVNFMDPMGLCAAKAAWNRISWEAGVAWGWFYENIYRYVVPGQIAWENALAAYDRGDYGWAAYHTAEMVAEDVLFAITLGYSQSALQSTRPVIQGVRQASKTIAGFSEVESGIINEARIMINSSKFATLRAAQNSGNPVIVNIGGRLIQYEPELQASGMTMFGENGFLIGREAFSSSSELYKTVLHELYRLKTSASSSGVSSVLATSETNAAFDFAERAIKVLFK